MKNVFPMVGMPDVHGIRGMFIGEEHGEPMYLTRFLMCLRTLSSHIDVLFLEMYDAGQVAPTSSLAAVQRAIGREIEYSYGWEPEPKHYLRLAQQAKILGLPVRGIDVPGAFESDTLTTEEEDALRDSSLFHDVWRQALVLQMRQIFGPGLAGKRYAIYGGAAHGPRLKEFLPQIVCYTLHPRDLSFREYVSIKDSGGDRPDITWA